MLLLCPLSLWVWQMESESGMLKQDIEDLVARLQKCEEQKLVLASHDSTAKVSIAAACEDSMPQPPTTWLDAEDSMPQPPPRVVGC